ncbi:hypothetical protein ACFWA6_12685 [Streptomyces sp. NPDC060020]|uniref:hypothetical protein n=1 Tax=Streptomyces sp. NPDC060020 TaxID=3347038 RepID=UPI003699002A
MDVAEHWHAFAWVGQERPADTIRVDPSQPTPPLEIAHWLKKPGRHVAATFENTPAGVKEASDWMRAGGEEHVHLSEESFSLDERMTYVEDDLSRGADVVWGYYSQNGRYVSRVLVACPRVGQPCPYGR